MAAGATRPVEYTGTGYTSPVSLARVQTKSGAVLQTQDATTQPVGQQVPNEGSSSSDTTTTNPVWSSAQQNAILTAIQNWINTVPSYGANGEPTNTAEQYLANELSQTGLFTPDELQWATTAFANTIFVGGNASTVEDAKGGNTSAMLAASSGWADSIGNYIESQLSLNATPPTTGTSGSGSSTTTNTTSTSDLPLISDLLGLLQPSGSTTGSGDSSGSTPEPVYYSTGGTQTSGGGNPVLGILLLVAAAIIGIWYYIKEKHAGKKAGAEAA